MESSALLDIIHGLLFRPWSDNRVHVFTVHGLTESMVYVIHDSIHSMALHRLHGRHSPPSQPCRLSQGETQFIQSQVKATALQSPRSTKSMALKVIESMIENALKSMVYNVYGLFESSMVYKVHGLKSYRVHGRKCFKVHGPQSPWPFRVVVRGLQSPWPFRVVVHGLQSPWPSKL